MAKRKPPKRKGGPALPWRESAPPMTSEREVKAAYALARDRYAAFGIDTDRAVRRALATPVSVHCWQADDVAGLEAGEGGDAGGLAATGNHPGAARNGDEIRQDLEAAAACIPGALRVNLHAIYAETGGKRVERTDLAPRHFAGWMDWAEAQGLGLDFNPTCFGHPMMKHGLSLSSEDPAVRAYWIEHCRASRRIAAAMAKRFGASTCNIWIPDGRKDLPADRWGPRERLAESLNVVLDRRYKGVVDAVESKLFGLGVESYTVGSHEFYLMYAARHKGVAVCLDLGHFHPTESVADKLSAIAPHVEHVLVHASRGVRWDSDHVVLSTPDLQELCDEAVRGGVSDRMLWALDFFDASIDRVGAYVVGARAMRKSLLRSFLAPFDLEAGLEVADQGAYKLGLMEHRGELPFGAVWDHLCLADDRPVGIDWIREVETYARRVLSARE